MEVLDYVADQMDPLVCHQSLAQVIVEYGIAEERYDAGGGNEDGKEQARRQDGRCQMRKPKANIIDVEQANVELPRKCQQESKSIEEGENIAYLLTCTT